MRLPLTSVLLFSAVLTTSGCGDSLIALNRLAAAGSIHGTAPLTTHISLEIAAPPARVWAVLVNAPAWPAWRTGIDAVNAPGPLHKGMVFSWTAGGLTIHSQVQRLESERSLGWTGTAWTAKAIHQWTLQPVGTNRTLVTVSESMEGLGMSKLYSSPELTKAAMTFLMALKQAAEQPPSTSPQFLRALPAARP